MAARKARAGTLRRLRVIRCRIGRARDESAPPPIASELVRRSNGNDYGENLGHSPWWDRRAIPPGADTPWRARPNAQVKVGRLAAPLCGVAFTGADRCALKSGVARLLSSSSGLRTLRQGSLPRRG